MSYRRDNRSSAGICLIIVLITIFGCISTIFAQSAGPLLSSADRVAKASLTYKVIDSGGGGYGYDIYADGKLLIHQPNIPAQPGVAGFRKKSESEKVAALVIKKLKNREMPPAINTEERGHAFTTDITLAISGTSPYCGGTSATVNYDASAFTFNPGNAFNVELSSATGDFSHPVIIGTRSSTATTGDITINFPLPASGTGYRIRVASTYPVVIGSDNGSDITITPGATPTITITPDPATTVGAGSVVYFSSVITEGGSVPTYEWRRNGDVVSTSSNAVAMSNVAVGDKVAARLMSSVPCALPATSNIVNLSVDNNLTKWNHAWEARASQLDGSNPIMRSNATGFTINGKAYVGCGTSPLDPYRKDFWAYDPATGAWTQMADVGGASAPGRIDAVGFSISTKGFIGTGISAGGVVLKDFWQYEQTTNTWLQRQNFPGLARHLAFGFSVGNKGYIGGGYSPAQGDFKDFYEFDHATNLWTARAEFAGGKRMGSAAFAIEGKGFVAGGFSSSSGTWFKDFWDFDQQANLWTKRADMPGNPRMRATGFALGGSGYVGLGFSASGYEGQFFQYTVSTNSWSWKPYYPGPSTKSFAVGMAVGNRAFVYKDGTWTEYNLFTTTSFSSVFCTNESFPLTFDASGFVFGVDNVFTAEISDQPNFSVKQKLGTLTSNGSTGTINAVIPALDDGVYYIRIISGNPALATMTEAITVTELPSVHSITTESGATVCKDVPVTFTSSLVGTGFQWLKNNAAVGTDAAQYVESSLANGDVIKCVRTYSAGCRAPVGVGSNTVVMSVHVPVKPTISILAPNTLTSSSALGYQWYLNGNSIARANAQSYKMTSSGVYKVRTNDNSGCFAFSDDAVDVYVGLEDDIFTNSVSLYPNPAKGEMILEVDENLVMKGCDFIVLNEIGQVVVGRQKATQRNKINLGGNSPGRYMIRLVADGATVVRRIIKVE